MSDRPSTTDRATREQNEKKEKEKLQDRSKDKKGELAWSKEKKNAPLMSPNLREAGRAKLAEGLQTLAPHKKDHAELKDVKDRSGTRTPLQAGLAAAIAGTQGLDASTSTQAKLAGPAAAKETSKNEKPLDTAGAEAKGKRLDAPGRKVESPEQSAERRRVADLNGGGSGFRYNGVTPEARQVEATSQNLRDTMRGHDGKPPSRVVIEAGASFTGKLDANSAIAQARGDNLADALSKSTGIPRDRFQVALKTWEAPIMAGLDPGHDRAQDRFAVISDVSYPTDSNEKSASPLPSPERAQSSPQTKGDAQAKPAVLPESSIARSEEPDKHDRNESRPKDPAARGVEKLFEANAQFVKDSPRELVASLGLSSHWRVMAEAAREAFDAGELEEWDRRPSTQDPSSGIAANRLMTGLNMVADTPEAGSTNEDIVHFKTGFANGLLSIANSRPWAPDVGLSPEARGQQMNGNRIAMGLALAAGREPAARFLSRYTGWTEAQVLEDLKDY